MISLLHGTARPERWKEICDQWFQNADNPTEVEYVLVYEPEKFTIAQRQETMLIPFPLCSVLGNTGRPCLVDAINIAADRAHGELLFYIADDLWSMPHWDTDIRSYTTRRPRGVRNVYWVNTGDGADKINHPLWTRAYQDSKGFYLWPEYQDLFSDTEFHDVAMLDGVIFDRRNSLFFTHVHASTVNAKYLHDEVNMTMLSRWTAQEKLCNLRKVVGFPTDMTNLKPLGENPSKVYIPRRLYA